MKRLIAVLFVLLLTGCGVRLDGPDPSPGPPSAGEVARQREALRADVLTGVDAEVAAGVAEHAGAHVEALGGVWVAWPDGDGPEDAPAPDTADIAVPTSTAELVDTLVRTAPDLVDAAIAAPDAETAILYAAIAASRQADLTAAQLELGNAVTLEWPATVQTTDPETIRALDAAAYALDVFAAQSSAAGVEAPYAADAFRLRQWADAAAESLGIAGTDDDPRSPMYDVTPLPEPATAYGDLTAVLASAVGQSAQRAEAVAAARAAATQTVLEGGAVPALPGLATD